MPKKSHYGFKGKYLSIRVGTLVSMRITYMLTKIGHILLVVAYQNTKKTNDNIQLRKKEKIIMFVNKWLHSSKKNSIEQ